MKKGTKVLVTGGAGFIGSHLTDRLVAKGMNVTVVDNLSAGYRENLEGCIEEIRFVEGDTRNEHLTNQLVQDAEIVFHLAANASVPNSVCDPKYDFETNVVGTFNLLHTSVGRKLRKFVLASSAAVYGNSNTVLRENSPLNPVSPYGATKLCGEILGFSFKRTYGVPFTTARIFNVYGPRLPRYVMYDFYKKLKESPYELKVLGDGTQTRQFCYIDDAVDALLLIADRGENTYNIAGAEAVSMLKLAEIFVSRLAPKARISTTGESWTGDIKNLVADIDELRRIGFSPKVGLDKGIDLFIEWSNKRDLMRS